MGVKSWLRAQAKKAFYWVWDEEIGGVRRAASQALGQAAAASRAVTKLHGQMSSLLALDVSLHETGKIIVMTRVDGRDRVKIVDMPREVTAQQYRELVEEFQERYGARVGFVDAPRHMDTWFKQALEGE